MRPASSIFNKYLFKNFSISYISYSAFAYCVEPLSKQLHTTLSFCAYQTRFISSDSIHKYLTRIPYFSLFHLEIVNVHLSLGVWSILRNILCMILIVFTLLTVVYMIVLNLLMHEQNKIVLTNCTVIYCIRIILLIFC